MMAVYVNKGETVEYKATAAVSRGDIVALGDKFGVAFTDIKEGDIGIVNIKGRYTVPAETGTAIAAGDVLYWNASGKKATKTSSGNTRIGIAANAMSSAGTSVDVIL